MLFCVGRNGKHAFADLKKIFRGGGGLAWEHFVCLGRGQFAKVFFYWNLINDPRLIRA